MRRALFFLLFVGCCLSLPLCVKRMSGGFRLAKLRLSASFRPEWEIEAPEEAKRAQLMAILNQPFTYLDRGAQCYVFASSDGKWVLKLFRYDQPTNPLRKFFRTHFRKKREKTPFAQKIESLFSACITAYTLARDETGLFFLHLNLTEKTLPSVRIRAPLGQTYTLPLDQYRFAIQRRGVSLRELFLRPETDLEEVKRRVHALFDLLKKRLERGIYNSDPNISRNFGFVGERAMEIDFGNFFSRKESDPSLASEEIERAARRLEKWIASFAPEWVSVVEEEKRR